MRSATETFAIELGRAAKKSAHLLRGFPKTDRDDALSAAMLSCWERKESFKQDEQSLEDWFQDALQVAARYVKRSQRSQHYTEMKLSEITTNDSTSRNAEIGDGLEHLLEQLTPLERKIAVKLGEGYKFEAVASKAGASRAEVKATIRKLRKLRDALPENEVEFQSTRTAGPKYDSENRAPAPIDHAIEALLRRPVHSTADCPVCWKCFYFEGLAPSTYRPTHIVDDEIRAAVHATEARKIEIANG